MVVVTVHMLGLHAHYLQSGSLARHPRWADVVNPCKVLCVASQGRGFFLINVRGHKSFDGQSRSCALGQSKSHVPLVWSFGSGPQKWRSFFNQKWSFGTLAQRWSCAEGKFCSLWHRRLHLRPGPGLVKESRPCWRGRRNPACEQRSGC